MISAPEAPAQQGLGDGQPHVGLGCRALTLGSGWEVLPCLRQGLPRGLPRPAEKSCSQVSGSVF